MTDTDYSPSFLDGVSRLLLDEGGYVDDPADPGGATKYGISQRSYPKLDIANLTADQAKEIYWRDWWLTYGFEQLTPSPVVAKCFELAPNMGVKTAIICLQRACRAALGVPLDEDGVLGPRTVFTVNQSVTVSSWRLLLAALKSEAAGHYRTIAAVKYRLDTNGGPFLRGWLSRAYR